MSAKLSLDILV